MLVSASVYDRCCSRFILPWTIFDVEMRLVPCVSHLHYRQNFSRSCSIFQISCRVKTFTIKSSRKCSKRKVLKSNYPLCRGSPVSAFRSIQVFNTLRTALPCSCVMNAECGDWCMLPGAKGSGDT